MAGENHSGDGACSASIDRESHKALLELKGRRFIDLYLSGLDDASTGRGLLVIMVGAVAFDSGWISAEQLASEDAPHITMAQRERIVVGLRLMDNATTSREAAFEKAVREAALGNFARAGALFRSWILDGATAMADAPHAQAQREQLVQRQAAAAERGKANEKYDQKVRDRWRELAAESKLDERGRERVGRRLARKVAALMAEENPEEHGYKIPKVPPGAKARDAPACEAIRKELSGEPKK